jgi:DNA-binding NarL/FixJ family response regulator
MPIRVLVVDDHPIVLRGLRSLLTACGADVVGEATNGGSAIRAAEELVPDVVLMDVQMPGEDGVAVTAEIVRRLPDVAVLMITMFEDVDVLVAAVRVGARGYLLKSSTEEQILRALEAVHVGNLVIGPAVAARLATRLGDDRGEAASEPFPTLTAGERETLGLLAQGCDNDTIARHLHLSPKTVRNRVSAILLKLGVANRTQAALVARERGLDSTGRGT